MRLNYTFNFQSVVLLLMIFIQDSVAQTISSNKTGKQGDYTMTLGEGCNFSCEWGQVNNILFRKGVRPGSKDVKIVYSAVYKPQGNSYLSIYGWFENPLVEYYIIESWGSWKPPSDKRSKGTVETDSGTYDIYQNSRTGASIKGSGTFQQYWSVRRVKRTSGIITCANHFNAWEKAGMTIGKFYEVSFNVEAYQSSGGNADVTVSMGTVLDTTGILSSSGSGTYKTFILPVNCNGSMNIYNPLGQKIAALSGREYSDGQHTVMFNASNRASGVYVLSPVGR
jgi:endo-1,4-beta-xylanase